MTSPDSPPNQHWRLIVVTIAVLLLGLVWWFRPSHDWVDSLTILIVLVVAYGIGRYLLIAIRDLTRTLRCGKCGRDALRVADSGTHLPKLGLVASYVCRKCGTRWFYNPFTKNWGDASGAEYDRRFVIDKK